MRKFVQRLREYYYEWKQAVLNLCFRGHDGRYFRTAYNHEKYYCNIMYQGKLKTSGIIISSHEREYLPIPHFHFYRTKEIPWHGMGGGCIMIEEPKYYKHGSHQDTLSPSEVLELIDFLLSYKDLKGKSTMWSSIIRGWNCTMPDEETDKMMDPDSTPMPDYKKLMGEHLDEVFVEMAGRIPGEVKLPGKPEGYGLIIAVGDYEKDIRHFHVFRNDDDRQAWRNGACLLFEENKYYGHGYNTETLEEDELNAVMQKLNSQHPALGVTNWRYLVALWNDNNSGYPLDPNLEMPEYDFKTITRYKEEFVYE
jgi:hypothetical protein